MSGRNNNNQGHNPIWADNSDRTFKVNTLLADLPSEPNKSSMEPHRGAHRSAHSRGTTAKQILVKILQETVQASGNILQKLTGRGNL